MTRRSTVAAVAAVVLLLVGIVGNLSIPVPQWISRNSKSSSAVYEWTEQRMRQYNHSGAVVNSSKRPSSSKEATKENVLFSSLQEGTKTTYCAIWEDNTDTWWVHHPMWDIWKENSTHTCFYQDPTYTYEKKIYDNQFNTNCDNNTLTRCMWSSGWSADFENVIYPLMESIDKGRPYALFNPTECWHYAANRHDCSQPTCPSMDMSCYFLKFGACPPAETQGVTEWDVVTTQRHNQLASSVYFYVTRQRQWVRQAVYIEVQQHIDHIPIGECAVMHVRRGDIVLHDEYSRKYYPISDYVDLLPKNRRGAIFLLTDDANALSEALKFYPEIKWHYFDRKRHKGTEGGWENQIPSKDPKEEVITILSTFQLVQRCDTFVYSTSGFAAYILQYMRKVQTVNQFRVDEKDKERRSSKHSNSDSTLAGLLDERRASNRSP